MHHIVCPIRPLGEQNLEGTGYQIADKVSRDALKMYYTNMDVANGVAQQLAAKHTQVQFGVFSVINIFECLAPPPPKVIQKRLNEAGEIVLAGGAV